jgi:glycosyltransferase 2 family protein
MPRKRLELFGGNLLSSLLFALALGAACRAYGVDLSFAELIFVNTAAGVLAGLVPVPGGIGAAEASLAAGLIGLGVDESTAFAIAVTRRLCAFYLPPIWGYRRFGGCIAGATSSPGPDRLSTLALRGYSLSELK